MSRTPIKVFNSFFFSLSPSFFLLHRHKCPANEGRGSKTIRIKFIRLFRDGSRIAKHLSRLIYIKIRIKLTITLATRKNIIKQALLRRKEFILQKRSGIRSEKSKWKNNGSQDIGLNFEYRHTKSFLDRRPIPSEILIVSVWSFCE